MIESLWNAPVWMYTSTRMMCAAVTSLGISIFVGPYFIKKLYEMKIGEKIRTDECPVLGDLHADKKETPTMGGVLILFSMLVSLLFWMDLREPFTWIMFITTVVLGCVGGYDDFLKLKHSNKQGLRGKKKLLLQGLLSGGIAAYLFIPGFAEWFGNAPHARVGAEFLSLAEYVGRIYAPFYKNPVFIFGPIIGAIFTMIVITGSSNAVNLTDGLDGLAAGCLILVAATFASVAFLSNNVAIASYLNIPYIDGAGEVAIYLSAFIGACLGFLWYNSHPAQVFMGDIGSLTLGGVIGVSAVLIKKELLLALVGGIFVVEALSVILQVASYRLRNKKRIFLCAPLHHHFEFKGWKETKVVVRFWIIGLLLSIIGLASLKFQ